AGLATAVTFLAFEGFAADALGGPDAKTPAVLLSILALIALSRRRWVPAALAGSLAALTWQPLLVYVVVAVAGAALDPRRFTRVRATARAIAAAAIPVAVTAI